ncbi:MAG: SMI1/KNR4 family protein [Blastocatellia bacterium]|nr:SMI1/KNR4 family protein [Blastocatellia bacterium]
MIESIPRSLKDRWELLAELVKQWRHPLTVGDGFPEELLRNTEQRLGCRLPLALRSWYLLAGNRKDLWSHNDELVPPDQLEIKDFLTIYIENQAVVEWGIRRADLDRDDPPVFVSDIEEQGLWHRQNPTVSEFALQMFVFQLKWSNRNRCYANGPGKAATHQVIERHYPRLPFPDWHWPDWPTRFYGNEEVVIESNGGSEGGWIWVCSRTEPAFRTLECLVFPTGLQWASTSDEWPTGWVSSESVF